jgi:uncharacterized protein YdeI (YjbR/CyaY-like superfamily)
MKFSTRMLKDGNNTGIEVPADAVEAIDVELTLDTVPRTVEVPADLRAALDASPRAAEAWEKLSFSNRKAHVEAVQGAKTAETRARRIAAIVGKLG